MPPSTIHQEQVLQILAASELALTSGQIRKRLEEMGRPISPRDLDNMLHELRVSGQAQKSGAGGWKMGQPAAPRHESPRHDRPHKPARPSDQSDRALGDNWTRLRQLIRYYIDAVGAENRSGIKLWAEDEGRKWLSWPNAGKWKPDLDGSQRIPIRSWMGGLLSELTGKGEELSLVYGFPTLVRRFVMRKTGEEATILIPGVIWEVDWTISGESLVLSATKGELPRLNEAWADEFLSKAAAQQWVHDQLEEISGADRTQTLIHRVEALIAPGRWADNPDSRILKTLPVNQTQWRDGVYPAAILGTCTSSQFTRGMIAELKWIADRASDSDIDKSALRHVFAPLRKSGADIAGEDDRHPENHGVFHPPGNSLNREQVQAVRLALSKKVTLVIGPPGTGKTDVAAAVGLNSALQNKNVLICSRNNVAVDEVEARLKEIERRLSESVSSSSRRKIKIPLVHRAGSSWGGKDRLTDQAALRQVIPKAIEAAKRGRTANGSNAAANHMAEFLATFNAQLRVLDQWRALDDAVHAYDIALRQASRLAYPDKWNADLQMDWLNDLDLAHSRSTIGRLEQFQSILRNLAKYPLGTLVRSIVLRCFGAAFQSRYAALHRELRLEGNPPGSVDSWQLEILTKRMTYLDAVRALIEAQGAVSALPGISDLLKVTEEIEALLREDILHAWDDWFPKRVEVLSDSDLSAVRRLGELLSVGEGKGLKRKDRAELEEVRSRHAPLLTRLTPVWCCTNLSLRRKLPLSAGLYDLALIDEASQCDIPSAIPILFRARRVVAIGDNNQLRHVSRLREVDDERMFAHRDLGLEEIGYLHSKRSLYDIVENTVLKLDSPWGYQMLHLHYRSHPDIIGFSSEAFYNEPLEVMTDLSRLNYAKTDRPAISWRDVTGPIESATTGSISDSEAKETIKLLETLLADRFFSGTIGVVTPFKQQALRIRQYLEQAVSIETIERHSILVDTAHAFQGGQRDVIILSLVYGDGMPNGSRSFLEGSPNLFNVAITRASSALHVVGGLEAARASRIDHIRHFAQYADKLLERQRNPPHVPESSIWEHRLKVYLDDAGIRTIPQHSIDRYYVDLAYVEDGRRIAIEVDGERYHLDERGRRVLSDYARDMRLRSMGWRVLRFWVWQIRDQPEVCLAKVKALVSEGSISSKEAGT